MSVGHSIAKQVLLGGLTQFLTSLRGLIFMPIIIKTAGESVFGAYILLASVVVFISGISSFGTNYAFRRGLPSTKTNQERRALLMPSICFRIASITILASTLFCWGTDLFSLLGESIPFSPGYLVLWLIGLTTYEIASDYYRYTSRFGVFNLLNIGQVYLPIGAIGAIVLWGDDLSLNTLLALQGVSLILLSLPPLVFGVIRETGLSWPRVKWRKFLEDARLGLAINGEFVVDFLMTFGDRYLIGLFITVSAVGHYQAAYALAGVLSFIPKLLSTVLTPYLCALWDKNDRLQAEKIGSETLRAYLVLSIPFVAGALLVGPSILALLTTQGIAATTRWATAMIATGILLYGFVVLVSCAAFVTRQTKIIIKSSIVAVLVNAVLNCLLLPIYPDVNVAAGTTIVSYGIAFIYAWTKIRPHFAFSFHVPTCLRALFATLVMGVFLWFAGYEPGMVTQNGIMYLILSISGAMLVYLVSFIAIGGLSDTDRATFFSLFRR